MSDRRQEDIDFHQKFLDFLETYDRNEKEKMGRFEEIEKRLQPIEDLIKKFELPTRGVVWLIGLVLAGVIYQASTHILEWARKHLN